jgi:hypothetical protein
MTLSDLASLGSFVSGIAVLVSLIYLALQVRQAEKNQRAALNQGYVDRTTENLRWLADAPQAELITRVMAGELNFTSEEVFRLSMAFRTSLLSTQDAFLQHRAGLIDEMTLENALLGLTRTYLRQPFYRAVWKSGHRETIALDFRTKVDAIIATTEPIEPRDLASRVTAELSAAAR